MSKLSNTQEFLAKRDLTLTESTGMLRDAALEQLKHQAELRVAAQRRAAREELELLRASAQQKRMAEVKRRRRVRTTIAAVCTLALGCGWIVGRVLWQDLGEDTSLIEK